MSNTIFQLKRSSIPGRVPTSLQPGELGINYSDGKLFYSDSNSVIRTITSGSSTNSYSTLNVNSSLFIATSNNDILTIDSSGAITIATDAFNDKFTIGVKSSSVSDEGVVQLYDGVDSNSTTLAATANAVYTAYELAYAAYNTSASGILPVTFKNQEFVATANQTSFSISGGYTSEYISVHLNGVLLDSTDYVSTDGLNVILDIPASAGDTITISKWMFDTSNYLSAVQEVEQFTSTANQTSFSTSGYYTEDYIKVYRNGILLETSDYSAPGGYNVTINYPVPANDIITLEYWGASTIDATPVYILANNASDTANNASNVANSIAATATAALETANSKLDLLTYGDITSNNVTTSTNSANQVLDIFSTTEFRSVKYQVQVTSGSDYQVSEISLIHNDTNSFITEYGLVYTGSVLMTYDSDISSGNTRLLMTPVNNVNTIKLIKTSIVV